MAFTVVYACNGRDPCSLGGRVHLTAACNEEDPYGVGTRSKPEMRWSRIAAVEVWGTFAGTLYSNLPMLAAAGEKSLDLHCPDKFLLGCSRYRSDQCTGNGLGKPLTDTR